MKRYAISLAAAAAIAVASFAASAQTIGFITIPVGAINNLQSQVIAKVVQSHTDLKIRVIPVGGGTATLMGIQNHAAHFTIGAIPNVMNAINGAHEFKTKAPDLRIVTTVQEFPIGIMVRNDSGIKTLEDLKGKRFPTGWVQFPISIVQSNALFATASYTIDDMDPVPTSGLIPAADDFKAGKSDATIIALVAPKVKEVNAAIPGGVRFLSVEKSPEAQARMTKVQAGYRITTVQPGPQYTGIFGPTNVLGSNLTVTAGSWVDDGTVYKLIKAMCENQEELVKGHPSFGSFKCDATAAQSYEAEGVQHHPGAVKYYKEIGVWSGS